MLEIISAIVIHIISIGRTKPSIGCINTPIHIAPKILKDMTKINTNKVHKAFKKIFKLIMSLIIGLLQTGNRTLTSTYKQITT